MKPLVVITTRLPPATCGIGTYSWLLHQSWPNELRPIEFLVVDDQAGARNLTATEAVSVFGNNAALLTRELERIGLADVLLHYAGRAYHRFGCPVWMPGVLEKWKRKFPDGRLMIFLHEMPGDFPLSSRHFWLGQLNSRAIRRLAGMADVLITNTESQAAKLRTISQRKDIHLVPVGSNIEAASELAAPRARTEFALFGLPFGRLQTLQMFDAHLRRWKASGRLTKLHIIGPDEGQFAAQARELLESRASSDVAVHHGILPSSEVSQLLGRVEFALTNVSAETWSKSTAFMACAANRCPVVVSGARSTTVPFSYAVSADEVETIGQNELTDRSTALAGWYHQNADWPVTARRIAALWEKQEAAT